MTYPAMYLFIDTFNVLECLSELLTPSGQSGLTIQQRCGMMRFKQGLQVQQSDLSSQHLFTD